MAHRRRDALINPTTASLTCAGAGQGAMAKTDCPSVEPAQGRAAPAQDGPNLLIPKDAVTSARPAARRARLVQATSLHFVTPIPLRTLPMS